MGILNNINKISYRIIIEKFLISLGIIFLIRVGSFLPIPIVNHTDLAIYINEQPLARRLVSTFAGEDTFVIGLFTLNIFPYVNASIIVQLITAFSPSLSQLRKEGDLKSRRSLNQLTRIIAFVWSIIQSLGLCLYLRQVLFNWNLLQLLQVVISLTTGAMIVMWLSELITDFGLGNGVSLLIYTNIVSSFPNIFKTIITQNNQNINIIPSLITISLIIISLYGVVVLQEGVRRVPLISSKQLNLRLMRKPKSINTYLPLKLNQAGVMPIILTTGVLVLPGYINSLGILIPLDISISGIFSKVFYWIVYFSLIISFSLFYSKIVLNPKDIGDQLQKTSVAIPGIRPGVATKFYLKKTTQRLTVIGASMLAILATLPNLIEVILNVSSLNGLSTTSLVIVVGVLADVIREVNDIIYSNIYKEKTF